MGSSTATQSDRIHELAVFLKQHGDVVLNGSRRLTFTTACLNELNYVFQQFLDGQDNDSFDIPVGSSGNSDFIHDVLFLHDFVQKTNSLKIVQSSHTIQGGLDLSKFHNLRILELKRVPPHLLVGLDALVLQLETLICQRNISSIKEILRNRSKTPKPWVRLKIANFSYNTITALDDSLAFLPKLQYFDCSNNSICDARGIQCLHNIKVLNLSFNFLEGICAISERAHESLTVLYLHNNCIESTQGLEGLKQLRELDLSFNCLVDGASLAALKQLPCLSMLKLKGNPITFHKDYPSVLVCHLHRKAAMHGFRLDDRELPRKLAVLPSSVLLPIRNVNVEVPSPVLPGSLLRLSVPAECKSPAEGTQQQQTSLEVTVHSPSPSKLQEEPRLSGSVEQDNSSCSSLETLDPVSGAQRSDKRPKKKRSTRVAAILNQETGQSPVKSTSSSATAAKKDILDYKSQLESRKQQLGDEWLIGVSRLRLPDAQSTPCGTPEQRSSMEQALSHSSGKELERGASNENDSCRTESPQAAILKQSMKSAAASAGEETSNVDDNVSAQRRISELSQGVVVLDDSISEPFSGSDTGAMLGQLEGFSWTTAEESSSVDETGEDLDAKLFLVQRCLDESDETVTLFLGIKDNVMKETDSLTGKLAQRLDLNSLASAVLVDNKVVRLKFDTAIRSKKERCFVFDSDDDAEEVLKLLQPFAEAKALKDLYEGALQCIKCGAQFPKQAVKKVVVCKTEGRVTTDVQVSERCPRCDGDILLVVDTPVDFCPPSLSARSDVAQERFQSVSFTNDGSAQSSSQDNVSEESIETVTPDQQGNLFRPGFRKSLSDITILSNPSQSSIMVISSSSGNHGPSQECDERTLSPPTTVTLPTLKEIVEEPTASMQRTENMSICQKSKVTASSDTLLSDTSFKSAQSHASVSQSSSPHKKNSLWELFEDREEIVPESFSCIDHRVRLFLEVSVFKQEEMFVCFLEVRLVTPAMLEEVPALFVLSNKRAYFFKITDGERDTPQSWLQLLESRPLEGLKCISWLLGNQGFTLSWVAERGTVPWYTCLLGDADRCNCFLQYLSGTLQQRIVNPPLTDMDVSENLAQLLDEVIACAEGQDQCIDATEGEVVLYVMALWCQKQGSETPLPEQSVSLVVTCSNIHVSKVHYLKGPKGSTRQGLVRYQPLASQKISNITAVHLHKDAKCAELTFLDEDTGGEMIWTITMESKASLYSLLNAMRAPWEELFGIEMPLTLVAL